MLHSIRRAALNICAARVDAVVVVFCSMLCVECVIPAPSATKYATIMGRNN